MTEREEAIALAKQILDPKNDLGWAAPLAREFQKLIGVEPKAVNGSDWRVLPQEKRP